MEERTKIRDKLRDYHLTHVWLIQQLQRCGISTGAVFTPIDTQNIHAAMDNVRFCLKNAGYRFVESSDPENCQKPHYIAAIDDSKTGKSPHLYLSL